LFLGHFATAYAAKRLAPRASLGALFAAAELPDLVWPVLVAAGVERATIAPGDTAFTPLRFDYYPFSHSLATVAALGAAFGRGRSPSSSRSSQPGSGWRCPRREPVTAGAAGASPPSLRSSC
jgi:hypothetical protein